MDLVGYLETLPQEALSRLYSSPWTSQAVLRGLPPLGKLYTLRMLYLEVWCSLDRSLAINWIGHKVYDVPSKWHAQENVALYRVNIKPVNTHHIQWTFWNAVFLKESSLLPASAGKFHYWKLAKTRGRCQTQDCTAKAEAASDPARRSKEVRQACFSALDIL